MKFTNTLTKQKEEFIPLQDKKVNMFVCGPTVYDFIHIGNARTFVIFDAIAKYLEYQGFNLTYIQNITDIDDKIIDRAQREKREWQDIAKEFENNFKEDVKFLGIDSVDNYAKASEHIEEVKKQVQILLDKEVAYIINGDGVYFDLSKFSEYGELSGRTIEMAEDAISRIDQSEDKRNKGDFALWKFSKENEPSWTADFGEGRPGWHIEDTAITEHYFGPQYDLHGGGIDLIFPHHEAEIAQQESISGLKPFVKYWLHPGFLITEEKKMSKSKGNFVTINKLKENYSKEALRFCLLSAHYRSPLEFSDKILKQAEAAVQRIGEFKFRHENIGKKNKEINEDFGKTTEKAYQKIEESLSDDFDMPQALSWFFAFIQGANNNIRQGFSTNLETVGKILDLFDQVIGVVPTFKTNLPEAIEKLVELRERMREEKRYSESDDIRSQIESQGFSIEDTKYGPLTKTIKKGA